MTYEQFYYEDPELVVIYREAQKLKDDNQNTFLWLQGIYMRDAIAEVISKCLGGKSSTKYPAKPYSLTKEDADKEEEENRQSRLDNLLQSLLKQNKREEDK